MKTSEEVLEFIEEQLWYLEKIAQDEGLKKPLLASITTKLTQDSLNQKYWLYQTMKRFIEGNI